MKAMTVSAQNFPKGKKQQQQQQQQKTVTESLAFHLPSEKKIILQFEVQQEKQLA